MTALAEIGTAAGLFVPYAALGACIAIVIAAARVAFAAGKFTQNLAALNARVARLEVYFYGSSNEESSKGHSRGLARGRGA